MPRHFQNYIDSQAARLLHHDGVHIFLRGIEHVIGLHLPGNARAVFIHFDRKNRSRAYGSGHGDRKESYRPATGDSNALRRNLPGQHGVYRVAQGVENRRIFLRNRGIELPDVRLRNHHILGECPIGINANDFHALANMRFAGAALQALATGNMHLGGYEIAFLNASHFIAERRHLSAEFMSWNQRRMNPVLCPAVPVVDVQIGATNGCNLHLHQHLGAPESGNLHLANLCPRGRVRFHHRQHCSSHRCHL